MDDKIFAVVSGLEKNADRDDIGNWIDLSQTEIFIVNNSEVIRRNIINESNQASEKLDKLK